MSTYIQSGVEGDQDSAADSRVFFTNALCQQSLARLACLDQQDENRIFDHVMVPFEEMVKAHGLHRSFACTLNNVGAILCERGEFGRAMGHFQEGIQFRTAVGLVAPPCPSQNPTEGGNAPCPDPTDMKALRRRAEQVWRLFMELENGSDCSFIVPLAPALPSFGLSTQCGFTWHTDAEDYCSCHMYQKSMEFESGPKWFSEPIRIDTDLMGDCGYESAVTIFNMALVDIYRGQVSRAEKFLEMALSLSPSDFFSVIGPILNNMGKIYYEEGSFADAADAFAEAVTLGQEAVASLPPPKKLHAHIAASPLLPMIASLQDASADMLICTDGYEEILSGENVSVDSSDDSYCDAQQLLLYRILTESLANKALVHRRFGEHQLALETLSELLDLKRKLYLEKSPQVMVTCYNMGVLHHQLEMYSEAQLTYLYILNWVTNMFGVMSLHRATILHDLGSLDFDCRRLHVAMKHLLEALSIKQTILGQDPNRDLAQILYSIGRLLHDREEFVDAVYVYEWTLSIQQKVLGPTHACVVRTLCNLGRVHHIRGNLEAALQASERVAELARDKPGNECFLASTLNLVGNIFLEMGETVKAMAAFEESKTVYPPGADSLPIFVSPLHYSGFNGSDSAAPVA